MRRRGDTFRMRGWSTLCLSVLSAAYVLMPLHVTSAAMPVERGSMMVEMTDHAIRAPETDADTNASVCPASHRAVSIRDPQERQMAILPVIRCMRTADIAVDRRGVRLEVSRCGGDPPSRALTGTVIKQE